MRFEAFVSERGDSLRLHALHDAIDEHLRAQDSHRYWGWPVWPEELRDPLGEGARAFAKHDTRERRLLRVAAVARRRAIARRHTARAFARHGDRLVW